MEKIIKQKKIWIGAAAGIVLLTVFIVVIAALKGGQEPVYRSIKIVELEGGVSIDRDGVGILTAAKNMNLVSGDRVTTAENAYVVLCLDTDKYVMLGEAGAMKVVAEGDENKGKRSISLEGGSVLSDIQNPLSEGSSYEIATPNATMSVRGTVFEVKKEDENGGQISVLVYDGSVAVGLDGKDPVLYKAGEYTVFTDGADPKVLVDRGTVSEEVLDDKVRERLQQISTEGRALNVGSADLSEEVTTTPAPTATPEVTAIPAPTATPEVTATPAPTATPEVTATPAPTATPEVTATPAPTATPEVTATPAPTAIPEVTATPAPAATPEVMETSVPEPEEDDEEEPEPTAVPTAEPAPAPTATPEVTATPAPTATPEVTATPAPAATPEVTATPAPTATPEVTATPAPTATPVPTWGPWPWWPTATPTVEPTTAPTAEPTAGPTAEPTTAPTAEPTAGPTAEPTAGPTAEPTTAPTVEPTTEPTAAPTVEPTATPTAAPSATPAPPQEGYCSMSYEIPYVLLSGKEPENAEEAAAIADSLVLGPSDVKKGEYLNWKQEKVEATTIPNHEDVKDLGFEFVGWYRINGTDPWNFDTDVIMEDMVLYPVWKDKDGNLYKVKVSEKLGVCYSIKEGTAATPSPAPSNSPSPAPSSEPTGES